MTFPLVGCETLTNPRVRGNLLVKYENMILVTEEAVCVCPRCRRTSGTTLPGMRSPAFRPAPAARGAAQSSRRRQRPVDPGTPSEADPRVSPLQQLPALRVDAAA